MAPRKKGPQVPENGTKGFMAGIEEKPEIQPKINNPARPELPTKQAQTMDQLEKMSWNHLEQWCKANRASAMISAK